MSFCSRDEWIRCQVFLVFKAPNSDSIVLYHDGSARAVLWEFEAMGMAETMAVWAFGFREPIWDLVIMECVLCVCGFIGAVVDITGSVGADDEQELVSNEEEVADVDDEAELAGCGT